MGLPPMTRLALAAGEAPSGDATPPLGILATLAIAPEVIVVGPVYVLLAVRVMVDPRPGLPDRNKGCPAGLSLITAARVRLAPPVVAEIWPPPGPRVSGFDRVADGPV